MIDKISYQEKLDIVWQYSHSYGMRLRDSLSYYESGDGYTALLLLYTVLEYVVLSALDDFDLKTIDAYNRIYQNGWIGEKDLDRLSRGNNSIRKIRNTLVHKDLNQFVLDMEGIAYPFSEQDTFVYIYEQSFSFVLGVIVKIIENA